MENNQTERYNKREIEEKTAEEREQIAFLDGYSFAICVLEEGIGRMKTKNKK